MTGCRPKEPVVRPAAAVRSRIENLPLANTYACSFSRPAPEPFGRLAERLMRAGVAVLYELG